MKAIRNSGSSSPPPSLHVFVCPFCSSHTQNSLSLPFCPLGWSMTHHSSQGFRSSHMETCSNNLGEHIMDPIWVRSSPLALSGKILMDIKYASEEGLIGVLQKSQRLSTIVMIDIYEFYLAYLLNTSPTFLWVPTSWSYLSKTGYMTLYFSASHCSWYRHVNGVCQLGAPVPDFN